MPLPTRTLTVQAQSPAAAKLIRLLVEAELSTAEFSVDGMVVPDIVSAWTDVDGVATLELFPNELGTQGSLYTFRVVRVVGQTREILWHDVAAMPDGDTDLQQIIGTAPNDQTFVSGAAISAGLAANHSTTARRFATEAEDVEVIDAETGSGTGLTSALSWAAKALKRATTAMRFATEAEDVEVVDAETGLGTGLNSSLHHAAKSQASAVAAAETEARLAYVETVDIADATHTIVDANNGKVLRFTNAAGCAVTLPLTSSLAGNLWFIAKQAGAAPPIFLTTAPDVLEVRGDCDRMNGIGAVATFWVEAEGKWAGGGDVTTA